MQDRHLHILWTNADVTTGKLMVMMYAKYSMKNGWWDKVTVILWGGTTRLMAESEEMQAEMRMLREEYGVGFVGCITCAKELGVAEKLAAMGIELTPWGPPLTELIRNKRPLISV